MEPVNVTVTLHTLCDACRNLCRDLKLLNSGLTWERSSDRYEGSLTVPSAQANLTLANYFGEFRLSFYSPEDEVRIRKFLEQQSTADFFEATLFEGSSSESDEHDDDHNRNEPESDLAQGHNRRARPQQSSNGMQMFFERLSKRRRVIGDLEVSAAQGLSFVQFVNPTTIRVTQAT